MCWAIIAWYHGSGSPRSSKVHRNLHRWRVSRDSKQRRAMRYRRCKRCSIRTDKTRWFRLCRTPRYRADVFSCVRFETTGCNPNLPVSGWWAKSSHDLPTKTNRRGPSAPGHDGFHILWNRTDDRKSRCTERCLRIQKLILEMELLLPASN